MTVRVREADPGDAEAIALIYNEGIEERQATFDTRPRTAAEMGERLGDAGAPPFLVAELNGRVAGWARVSPTSSRECYAGVGEASIYVGRGHRAAGVGRALLEALAAAAERAGYWKLVGLVFPTNAASVGLLRAVGFRDVGMHRRHGRLEGEWRDVLVLERLLGPAAVD
jgi:phosphinothricin acetyltransferase